MIDPSCDDITGRTLEALARLDVPASSRPVRRGVEFLKRRQEADECKAQRAGDDQAPENRRLRPELKRGRPEQQHC